jgi:hypothetical protein
MVNKKAVDFFEDENEEIEKTVEKKPARAKKEENLGYEHHARRGKNDHVSFFALAVVAIVILGIVGIIFGYTKDQIAKVQKNTNDQSLLTQIDSLKEQLNTLTDKANSLEDETSKNKEIVLSLFDKSRSLPDNLDMSTWKPYENKDMRIKLALAPGWEVGEVSKSAAAVPKVESTTAPVLPIKDVAPTTVDTSNTKELYTMVLQPVGDATAAGAITIKDDYADFWNLSIKDKAAMFADAALIDVFDSDDLNVKTLYFIDAESKLPTIVILTTDRILRVTFNMASKTVKNYMQYRVDFESMAMGVATIAPIEAKPLTGPEKPKK